jgi:hypothetical protein
MTSHLLFVTGSDSKSIVQRLFKLKDDRAYKELYISMINLDDVVSRGIVDVLQDRSRPWDGIHIAHCTGKVDVLISNVLELESVQKRALLPDGHCISNKCVYTLVNGLCTTRSGHKQAAATT